MSYALSRPTTARRGGLLGIVIGAHIGVILIVMAAKTVAPQIMEMPLIVDLIQPAQEKPPEAKPLPVVKPQPVRWADQCFKGFGWRGGWGIMWDDLVAAFCTLLVIALWRHFV